MVEQASQSTRDHIIDAVISCIEKYGVDNLTTRKIAEEAGTNIASINYYFRSKDLAVAEALSIALKNSIEDFSAIAGDMSQSFEHVLEALLLYLIEGSLRFRGVTIAHFYSVLIEGRTDTPAAEMMSRIYDLLLDRAIATYPKKPAAVIRMALAETLSAAMFNVLAPALFQPKTSIDVSQSGGSHALAHYLAQMFIHNLDIPVDA